MNGLFIPLLNRPRVQGCLCRAVAAAAAAAAGIHCGERPTRRCTRLLGVGRRGSARRGGVTAAGTKRRFSVSLLRDLLVVFSVCSPNLSSLLFRTFFSSRNSRWTLSSVKLAPLLRFHLLRASSRARPRTAMASSAPSPASAVDFLTLLTKLKVGLVVFEID